MNEFIIVAAAGLLAGAMNAVAGGGSFITLPVLVAVGVPSLNANATSTVALVPSALASAYAYRHDFRGFDGVRLSTMAVISVVGGALGAVLLIVTPQSVFDHLFPFLLLFGALVFSFGRGLGDILRRHMTVHASALPITQFFLGVYGGYFGGAVGVMMLATWTILTRTSINNMQASRHLLNASMNTTASILMIASGLIYWSHMAVMLVTAIIGGYGAAAFGRRLDQQKARVMISILNFIVVALIFWRQFG
ncbi:MAG: sulfite exporter TauE/SafE family protein [Ancalomicrobiaceae bacterium]|nr:sulfite exporter TauE/SafE family protein [Ancalomicrobiaceae bacterium]